MTCFDGLIGCKWSVSEKKRLSMDHLQPILPLSSGAKNYDHFVQIGSAILVLKFKTKNFNHA